MKRIYIILFVFSVPFAHADDAVIDMSRQMQIASLKREISELEIKLAECNQKENESAGKTETQADKKDDKK